MLSEKYPAREHARKVAGELYKLLSESDRSKMHAIFLQAPPSECRHDTDRELTYHQEANFTYLSGCSVPEASVLVAIGYPSHHDHVSHHHLFIPPAVPEVTMWSVAPPSTDEAKATFDSDNIVPTTSLPEVLHASVTCTPELVLHTLPLTQEYASLPTSVLDLIQKKSAQKDGQTHAVSHRTDLLLRALHIARLTKDEHEIALIRKANQISSGAHEVLMRELGRHASRRKDGEGKGTKERTGTEAVGEWEVEAEGDAEALFVATCKRMGAGQAYLPICASGSRASTLHYVCNDRLFPSTSLPRAPGDTSFAARPLARGCCGAAPEHEHSTPTTSLHAEAFEPQMLLIDAGCEWENYASDITRTIPIGNGGKYTKEAGEIYELVLRMQKECEALVSPGTHWDTIHLHAHKVLVDGLLSLGILRGDPETILQSGLTAAFFPHGLGHSLGLDVHDSLQYLRSVHLDLPPTTSTTPAKLYAYLRIRQTLLPGMVLTVEPGCYFAPQLMEAHGVWTSEHVDKDTLRRYVPVGGVRIEDVVVVREGKCENLTTVGRDRDWVERVCSGEA